MVWATNIFSAFCSLINFGIVRRISPNSRINNELWYLYQHRYQAAVTQNTATSNALTLPPILRRQMLFKKKKLAKHTSVYISDKYEQIIIAPRHVNNAGIIYEQENCKTINKSSSVLELGTEVIESMNLFSFKDINLRDSKLTDWPSFKHSKSKSVRAFEQEYIHISVDSCNEYNLIIEVEGFPHMDSELTIKSTISFYAEKEEIGKRIMKVYEDCLTRKI